MSRRLQTMRDWRHDTDPGDRLTKLEFACLLLLQSVGIGSLLASLLR